MIEGNPDLNIDVFKVRCLDNKEGKYALTKHAEYWVIGKEGGFWYVKNNKGEFDRYSKTLFEMIPISIGETKVCSMCGKIKKATTFTLKDFPNVCVLCEHTIPTCSVCKAKTIDNKMIGEKIYCKKCYEKEIKSGNFVTCVICKKSVHKDEEAGYGGCGNLCRNCKDRNLEREFNDFRGNDNSNMKNFEIASRDTTFDEFPDRTFGVEFEMKSKKKYLRHAVKEMLSDMKSIKIIGRPLTEYIRMKHDSSLDNMFGIEITTTILRGDAGKRVIEELVDIFKRYFTTDNKCGLHIHIGVQDYTETELNRLYYVYQQLEGLFPVFVAKRRLNNKYCQPLKHTDKDEFLKHHTKTLCDGDKVVMPKTYKDFFRQDRYTSVNFDSVQKYNTLELRVMEGHLVLDRLLKWLEFNLKVVDYTRYHEDVFDKDFDLKEAIGEELYDVVKKKKVKKGDGVDVSDTDDS